MVNKHGGMEYICDGFTVWTALERIWLDYVGFLPFDVRIDWDLE